MSGNAEVLQILFPVEIGGVHPDDLAVDGRALDRAEARAENLLTEMFADRAYELLQSWERVCATNPGPDWPLQMRHDRVLARLRELGDIKQPYFVAVAAGMGYEIEIEDYPPIMAGWGRAGDIVYIPDSIYIWWVRVFDQPTYLFRAGQSAAGERLSWFIPASDLEATLNDLKPAEVFLYFVYP